MMTETAALDRTYARQRLVQIHTPPKKYGLLADLSCFIGRHDYDGLIRADAAGRLVRNCLKPNCRRTQPLTPPVIFPG